MKWLYLQSAAYYTTTALVKVSLLLQYLRMFRSGTLRKISIALLVLVTIWGLTCTFAGWFPCFPVSGFWNRLGEPNAKCYGFGFGSIDGAYAAFVSFAATNMAFDTAIFLIPIAEFVKSDLRRKQVIAMVGIFTLGFVYVWWSHYYYTVEDFCANISNFSVVLMSILRLFSSITHKPDDIDSMDFTWWYPLTLIFSCLEVDFAIICASIPIFWPVIVASLPQIFVTKEVIVTHHKRFSDFYNSTSSVQKSARSS